MRLLTCKEVSHLVSQGEDRKLALAERVLLRLHLLVCRGCRSFERQLRFLRLAIARLARTEDEARR